MKHLFILLFGIFTISDIQAQKKETKTPEEFADARTAFLKHLLELDEIQEASVHNITQEHYTLLSEIKDKKIKDKKALEAEYKKNRSAYNKEMKAILTKEQFKKWNSWKGDKKLKSQGQKPKNKPDKTAPPDETVKELDID